MSEAPATSATPVDQARGSRPWRRVGLGLLALLALIGLGRVAGDYIEPFTAWVHGLGAIGPIVFISGYVLAVVAMVPASLLTLAAGAVFGIGPGTAYVFVAASLGATLAFLVARYVARAPVEHRLEGNAKFSAIDRAVGVEGRKIVFLLRLSPVFPFNLLNYALGLTSVRLSDYVVACLGMLPGTLLYVYLGHVAAQVAAAAGGTPMASDPLQTALLWVGLAATVIAAWVVVRAARRALDEVSSPEPPEVP